MPSRVTSCPNCGGQVEFKAGTSLLSVCPYCSSAVARLGDDVGELEILGQVAPLSDIGSPLWVGADGKYNKKRFTIVGRVQLNYGQGPWNEWYAAFDDGRWGWIGEAQGRVYLTFGKELAGLPRYAEARPGTRFHVGPHVLTVVERRRARFVAAEGELPFAVAPGSSFNYCDVEGPNGLFGTIDYGTGTEPEELFLGESLRYDDLFDKSVLREVRAAEAGAAAGLNCPNCGAGVELRAPDESERITCPACDSLLDCSKGNELYLLSSQKFRAPPPEIPLGSAGKIDNVTWTVFGHLVRSVVVDGIRYAWEEYLLHARGEGYRWLVCSEGHWSFVGPAHAGDIAESAHWCRYRGKHFFHFQSASASVDVLRGEFYWKVSVGERVGTMDYVSVPYTLSKERAADEVSWSLGRYLEREEVEKAFKLKRPLPRPVGVAPNQPNPHKRSLKTMVTMAGAFSALLLVFAAIMAMLASETKVVHSQVGLVEAPGEKPPVGVATRRKKGVPFASDPFQIGERTNMAIRVLSNTSNAWLYVNGRLVNESLKDVRPFGVYLGARGDRTIHLGGLRPGQYVMHLTPEWGTSGTAPSRLTVYAQTDVFVGSHAVFIFFLLWAGPLIQALRYYGVEKQRWAQSDHAE